MRIRSRRKICLAKFFMTTASEQSYVRAFIAVEINDAIRAGLADVQSTLKEANAHVSWVLPQNIHCTLVFFGDIFLSVLDSVADALSQAVKGVKPFEIEIAGLGYFGSAHSPRIIWSGIAGAVTPLVKLQNGLVTAILAAGLKPDLKPFSPHLTIGRVRSNRNAAGLVRAMEKNKNKSFGKLAVQRIVLMQSRLMAEGPEYTILKAVILNAC